MGSNGLMLEASQKIMMNCLYCLIITILLSETWLNNTFDSRLINRPGFVLYRQDRGIRIKKRGGGLAIYIKSAIALYASITMEISDVTCNLEQMWIHVKELGRKYFVGSVLYRPPAGCM